MLFIVCVNPAYIRDAQILCSTKEMSDEEFGNYDIDDYSDASFRQWGDIEPKHFVTVLNAANEKEACELVGKKYWYDPRILYAFEAKSLEN